MTQDYQLVKGGIWSLGYEDLGYLLYIPLGSIQIYHNFKPKKVGKHTVRPMDPMSNNRGYKKKLRKSW